MSWRCATCGEQHDDAFDSCWRCGADRPSDAAGPATEDADQDEMTPDEAPDPAEAFDEAVVRYQYESGWYSDAWTDKWTQAAQGWRRLRIAYQFYRERQELGGRPPRPDLDRLWSQFFVATAGLLGVVLGSQFFADAWARLIDERSATFGLLYGGALSASVGTGMRVVKRELRAAAETAVRRGGVSPRRVA